MKTATTNLLGQPDRPTAPIQAVTLACILSAGIAAQLVSSSGGQHPGEIGQIIAAKLLALALVFVIPGLAGRKSAASLGDGLMPNTALVATIATLAAVTLAAIAVSALNSGQDAGLDAWLRYWWLFSVLLVPWGTVLAIRATGRLGIGHGRRQRVAIVGAGEEARRLMEAVTARDVPVIGVFDDRAPPRRQLRHDGEGRMAELIALAHRSGVDHIIIALPAEAEDRLATLLQHLRQVPVRVSLAPDPSAGRLPPQAISRVGGIPVIDLAVPPFTWSQKLIKEGLDRALSLALLLVLWPVILAIAVLIRLEGPGPIFFIQERHGLGNRIIRVHKFRTMHAALSDPDGQHQTSRDDPRITRIGRVLRRTSLDELPQLWNVLIGDMSLVGPRPHPVGMLVAGRPTNDVDPFHLIRHRVKPGITGLAQVNGFRGGVDDPVQLKDRVTCDLKYIEEWSIWLDIAIILCTLRVVISQKNAF